MDWFYFVHSNLPEWQSHFLTGCAVVLAAIKDSNAKLLFTLLCCVVIRQENLQPCLLPADGHQLF